MRKKLLWRLAAIGLSGVLSAEGATPPVTQIKIEIDGSAPEEVVKYFRKTAPSTAEESFTLAMAYFGMRNMHEAIDNANQAMAKFNEKGKKAICYQLIAQAYGALGEYRLAANAATEGQRLVPNSKELATLRVAYFKKMGDTLNYEIANEHLMRLDPSYEKNPKMEPVTGAVIITGMIVLLAITALVAAEVEDDPQIKVLYAKAFSQLCGAAGALGMLCRIPLKA